MTRADPLDGPWQLSDGALEEALGRLAARDPRLADEAAHIVDALTAGEGPERLYQGGLQDWLWYTLPKKYLVDEPGYMSAMADHAAQLFDEVGLIRYAEICRGTATGNVHAAFERSDHEGFEAMRTAVEKSGISPPDLEGDFTWGEIMGIEESMARTAVEMALERSIAAGELTVGRSGWRKRQAAITTGVLDQDHPEALGQSPRTAIMTERIGMWAGPGAGRTDELGARRQRLAKEILSPIDPPDDVAELMAPVVSYLTEFGAERPMTSAGYLTPASVQALLPTVPTDWFVLDEARAKKELDCAPLLNIREWLQAAGALRRHKGTLKRLKVGDRAAADPAAAWSLLVANPIDGGSNAEVNGAVLSVAAIVLVESDGPIRADELAAEVAEMIAGLGWRTADGGRITLDLARRLLWVALRIVELFGVVRQEGSWPDRSYVVSAAGRTTLLAILRHTAAGPRQMPGFR